MKSACIPLQTKAWYVPGEGDVDERMRMCVLTCVLRDFSQLRAHPLFRQLHQVMSRLLDITATPRKPNYEMAPDAPLVLYSCAFDGLTFHRSGGAWLYMCILAVFLDSRICLGIVVRVPCDITLLFGVFLCCLCVNPSFPLFRSRVVPLSQGYEWAVVKARCNRRRNRCHEQCPARLQVLYTVALILLVPVTFCVSVKACLCTRV